MAPPGAGPTLRIATRGSALAVWQAEEVARQLKAAHPECRPELVVVETSGDLRLDVPVWDLGGQGVFVKEVQLAVLDGRADLAVHSAKDLPSVTADGLVVAAVPPRADPRDALVGSRLDDLAPGAVVATGSVRRRAQMAWIRPDLSFVGLRGNIATRLGRIPEGGAILVAAAALERLGLLEQAAEVLDPAQMLPQVGQGAMAVECRSGPTGAMAAALLSAIDDRRSRLAVTAERAFLACLGGGCDLPVGAHARFESGEVLEIEGLLASPDGRVVLRMKRRSPQTWDGVGALEEAANLGVALAQEMLSHGGSGLLAGGLG